MGLLGRIKSEAKALKAGLEHKAEASKADREARLEAALGPPSKTMDASEYAQTMVGMVTRTIESHLGLLPQRKREFTATQMITRSVSGSSGGAGGGGTMYYVKIRTHVAEWPWVFVKIHEPPVITTVSNVEFVAMKKMKEEYKLVTF